jgi:hypothetical protein
MALQLLDLQVFSVPTATAGRIPITWLLIQKGGTMTDDAVERMKLELEAGARGEQDYDFARAMNDSGYAVASVAAAAELLPAYRAGQITTPKTLVSRYGIPTAGATALHVAYCRYLGREMPDNPLYRAGDTFKL